MLYGGTCERKGTQVKIFGGNGRRENNSGSGERTGKTGDADGNYINETGRGHNNTEVPKSRVPEQTPAARRAPRPQKPKKRGKGWLIALAVIAVIAAGLFIYWKATTKPPETTQIPVDPQASATITDTETREIGHYYTILVVGIDQLGLNTDTMMLVRYDAVEHKANIVSIPRDTAINTPDPVKKINAAYLYAENRDESGIDALMSYVKDVTGFMPDNYVLIDTDVFVQAIDALGGVYFDVPVNMNYDDYADNDDDGVCEYVFTIHVQKGYQLLNGENALGVFRFRQNNDGTGYGMGDLDRLDTQHTLIKAVASQALQLKNLTNLVNIAQIVIDNSQTDLSMGNMQWYAQEFLKMSADDINLSTVPTTGAWINNLSYVTINVDDWMTIVNEQFNPLKLTIKAEDCSILCQKAAETGTYTITPGNYYTTDGKEVYLNFYKNPQY